MPRSSSSFSTPGCSSWLFAPPQTILADSAATVGSSSAQPRAHGAYTSSGQGRLTPHVLGGCAHALEDAERGENRGITGAAMGQRASGDELGLPGDDVHVLDVGADVACGDIAPAQRLHEAPVGAQ